MARQQTIARILRWLVPLLISGLVIWLVLHKIDVQVFLQHLGKISWQSLVISIFIFFISYALRSYSWFILLRQKVTYGDAFFTMGVGYLINNILPFRLGEFGRAIMLDDSGRITPLEVFSSVIVERILDVFLAALFFLSVLPRVLSSNINQNLILIAFFLAIVGLIALFFLAKYRHQVLAWLNKRMGHVRFMRDWLLPKIARVLEGFVVLSDPKAFLMAFASLALSWWLAFIMHYLLFRNFNSQPPFWWMIFVLSAGAFGAALPSAPAGLGVYEGVVVASFAVLGVDAEIALTHAILTHAISFLFSNLIGLIGLRRRGEALAGFVKRVLKRSPGTTEIM